MKHVLSFTDKFPDLREDLQDLFLEFKEDHGFNVDILPDIKITPAVKTSYVLVGHNFTYPQFHQRNIGYTPPGDWMWGYIVLLSKVVKLDKRKKEFTKKRGKRKREVLTFSKDIISTIDEFIIKKSNLIMNRTPNKIELYGVKKSTISGISFVPNVEGDEYYECIYEIAFI